MLTPTQVIPFLTGDDDLAREYATRYFEYAHDTAPLTADDVWTALRGHLDARQAAYLIGLLSELPQSDATAEQLLAAIEGPVATVRTYDALLDALDDIDLEQLRRHRDRIFALPELEDDSREHLEARLALAELPADAVWDQLVAHCRATREDYWDQVDHRVAARLVEALARDPESPARAMAILESQVVSDDAMDIYAVDLLARVRHRPALELLIKRLAECPDDDEVLPMSLARAIPRVGGIDAVPLIESRFAGASWGFRITAPTVLGRIKHPASEAALFRLLNHPDVGDARGAVLDALATLCTTDGLPPLRDVVIGGHYDPLLYDHKRDLVACAMMAGYDFPELPLLREEVVAREIEAARRLDAFDREDLTLDDLPDDLGPDQFADDYDDDYLPALPDSLDDRMPVPTATIRNEAPKVGRNDPCPCGSGKKYKKCCLK